MHPSENGPEFPSTRRLDRFQALLEVVLLSGVFSSFFATLPFALSHKGAGLTLGDARTLVGFLALEATITLVLLFAVLRSHGETAADLGLRRTDFWSHTLTGLLVVPFLFGANIVVALAFKQFLPGYLLEHNPLVESIRTRGDLLLFSGAALYAGGLKEELQRAFILSRFSRHLGGPAIGLVLWSLAFGVGHYLQGLQGVVAATLFGFLFGAVYLARRSLIAPIVAHAVYDTLALWGYWLTRSSTP